MGVLEKSWIFLSVKEWEPWMALILCVVVYKMFDVDCVRGMTRGLATFPQGNHGAFTLVFKDKIGRPQVILG